MIKLILSLVGVVLLITVTVCGQESKTPTDLGAGVVKGEVYRIITWGLGGCIAESKTYNAVDHSREDKPPIPIPCDGVIVDDQRYRLIYDEGITLAVTTVDLDNSYLALHVQVLNKGTKRILVDPSQAELAQFDLKDATKLVYIKATDPHKIAEKYVKNAKWSNFFRSLGASMAQKTTTVNTTSGGSVMGTGGSAIYTSTGTATISEPDGAKQQQASRENARTTADAQATGNIYLQNALRTNTVWPSKEVSGNLYFKYPDRKTPKFLFIITIEGTEYIFVYVYGPPKH